MIETANLENLVFKQNDEIKALSNETVKTIRDIIQLNPLYRDMISQLLQGGQSIVDNPAYLSDLAATFTSSAESKELQEVLEELDVRKEKRERERDNLLNSTCLIYSSRFKKDFCCRLNFSKKSLK
jgi:hypothetical protein